MSAMPPIIHIEPSIIITTIPPAAAAAGDCEGN